MVKNDEGRYVLAGVTSFGFGDCGESEHPGFYANVANVVGWIQNTTNLALPLDADN